ncbi:hypothetical protein LTR94_032451, partial [Friedmanniomyces endolithicus]
HRHRIAHPAAGHRRTGADHRGRFGHDPRQRLCQRAGYPARADPERGRNAEPAIVQRRQLHPRRAAGGLARAGSKSHACAGQRPPPCRRHGGHQRGGRELHLEDDDRTHRHGDGRFVGGLWRGRRGRGGQLHHQAGLRRHRRPDAVWLGRWSEHLLRLGR